MNDDFPKAKECFEKAKQLETDLPYFLDTLKDRNIANYNCWLQSLSITENEADCASDLIITKHKNVLTK
ncbi:MAG: hypothetical protein K2X81_25490 [Candidatus Obscuribacterales bacterium]|nr:hypothetical protein [Candidatus Obscuribacterales bacterium]